MSSQLAIVYYSLFGLTRRIAEDLSLVTDGDLVPLSPVQEYSFEYNTAAKEIRQQLDRGFCPELIGGVPDFSPYSMVLVGSPNWFHTFAPPVLTVLRKSNLGGRTLAPFCAHGGGGLGTMEADLARECPTVRAGGAFGPDYTLDDLRLWLDGLGIDHG